MTSYGKRNRKLLREASNTVYDTTVNQNVLSETSIFREETGSFVTTNSGADSFQKNTNGNQLFDTETVFSVNTSTKTDTETSLKVDINTSTNIETNTNNTRTHNNTNTNTTTTSNTKLDEKKNTQNTTKPLKKPITDRQRLDTRQKTIVFDSKGEATITKTFPVEVQAPKITDLTQIQTVDENFIANKHLLIVNSDFSKHMYTLVKSLLPFSYLNKFSNICLYRHEGREICLLGPYIFSRKLCLKLGLDYPTVRDSNKHIWVLDCPKIRDNSLNISQVPEVILQSDPHIRAFGFPPPEGFELEAVTVMSKIARYSNGKILSSDTGNFVDISSVDTGFVWRTNKILPPEVMVNVLVELFGTDSVGYDFAPKVLDDSEVIKQRLAGMFMGDDQIVDYLKSYSLTVEDIQYLFGGLRWVYNEYDVKSIADVVVENLGEGVNSLDTSGYTGRVNMPVLDFSRGGRNRKMNVTKSWVNGYSFSLDFGFSSKLFVYTNGMTDVSYRVSDVDSQSVGSDSLFFEYIFSWLPKDMGLMSKVMPVNVLREQKIGLFLLKKLGGEYRLKHGGILLNRDLLPVDL